MFHTSTMLRLGATLYLLLSLNAVPSTAEDLQETRETADTGSPRHLSSTSTHPEPGLPADARPDPVFLTSGEIDPVHPLVVHLPRHSMPSEDADGHAAFGEYEDTHDSAEGISPSNSGLEEASGGGAEDNEPPARPHESTEVQPLWSVPRPGSGTTHTSAVDLAPATQDRGRVDQSVSAQDGPVDSQKTEPTTNEDGLTGCPLDRGNNSRPQKVEDSLDEDQDSDISATLPHPDCNSDPTDESMPETRNQSCTPVYPEDFKSDKSPNPFHFPSPPFLIPLYSDWNSAMATWGVAWEAHIYGVGSIFAMSGFISVVCLLGLPLRCPMGSPYFTLLHLLLLAFGGIRAFSLLYDAYSHQERLPPLASLLLSELSFPCLASAFSLAFILLSLRSRMHSSLRRSLSPVSCPLSPSPCLLLCLSFFHGMVSLGCVGLLQLLPSFPALLLLPRGLFVCLSVLLPFSYLIFYCLARAQTKHIFRLGDNAEGGGSPEVLRPTKCPFAEVEDWARAAGVGIAASLCLLACGGLQLYGLLHYLGLGGVGSYVFEAWPWWSYQLSCRLCEVAVCLGLALIGAYPLFCGTRSPVKSKAPLRPGSWSQLPSDSPSGGPAVLASLGEGKSVALSPHFLWSQGTQEKLVVCEITSNGQSEALPLCPLVDPLSRISTLESTSVLPRPAAPSPPRRTQAADYKLSSLDSLGLDADSTGDLRPPSPIDLSRSIDQALFSDALFSRSIFGPPRLPNASSSLSLNSPVKPPLGYSYEDSGLYRTTSCGDADHESPLSKSQLPDTPSHQNMPSTLPEPLNRTGSTPGAFDQASIGGSSQGLCSDPGKTRKTRAYPWANRGHSFAHGTLPRAIPQLHYHRRYRTLSLASQGSCGSGRLLGTEHLSKSQQLERDLEVQAEFVHVCRQIDSQSVCSDTIEL
ncbi:proline-rich transmembrane protein 4 [Gadus chalcogrammus]|uniref:proline-rich transmembrane protein 4 n=1 Tax=Gadus chalcogrammus TaxID=1042646 RepID=UPI0024C4C9E8|nr:proline-rich transmembrane protein 4 [Gadus chalcogrammus]